MSRTRGSANYGIQANTVTGGAIAVGEGATATQNITGSTDTAALKAALDELRATLSKTGLPAETQAMLEPDVQAVAAESGKPEPDAGRIEAALKSLASKIKMLAPVAKGAADLIEPVGKIAAAIGVGATALGLL